MKNKKVIIGVLAAMALIATSASAYMFLDGNDLTGMIFRKASFTPNLSSNTVNLKTIDELRRDPVNGDTDNSKETAQSENVEVVIDEIMEVPSKIVIKATPTYFYSTKDLKIWELAAEILLAGGNDLYLTSSSNVGKPYTCTLTSTGTHGVCQNTVNAGEAILIENIYDVIGDQEIIFGGETVSGEISAYRPYLRGLTESYSDTEYMPCAKINDQSEFEIAFAVKRVGDLTNGAYQLGMLEECKGSIGEIYKAIDSDIYGEKLFPTMNSIVENGAVPSLSTSDLEDIVIQDTFIVIVKSKEIDSNTSISGILEDTNSIDKAFGVVVTDESTSVKTIRTIKR